MVTRTRRARQAPAAPAAGRVLVADQLRELVLSSGASGGRGTVSHCLMSVLEAERRGDNVALRAATMELSVAAADWAITLDLR